MREDLLHYIWKLRKLPAQGLMTTDRSVVNVISPGIHNRLAGPDFLNAKIRIGNQLWVGNVEIHMRASDWYLHGHHDDPNYDAVILHVVWEDDVSIFRADDTCIPTLSLKDRIPETLLRNFQRLFDRRGRQFINCEGAIARCDAILLRNWFERLFVERLQHKTALVESLLEESKNDWEGVLFRMLLQAFGSKFNAESFLDLGRRLPFGIVRKLGKDAFAMEALFLGASGLLEGWSFPDAYLTDLRREYAFLCHKFDLHLDYRHRPGFARLRPTNFPTLRLSQLAALYTTRSGIFDQIIGDGAADGQSLFKVAASSYWDTHYTFGKTSRKRVKWVSRPFIDLLIINTVIPLRFSFARKHNTSNFHDLAGLLSRLPPESNSIVDRFAAHGIMAGDALESQAMLQLYHRYCDQNRCLQCAVGNRLLQSDGQGGD